MEKQTVEEWFELYERDVTSFLIYYTGSMDVQDIVQETFLRAIRKFTSFQASVHPKTWLIAIAKNIVIDRHRKKLVWEKIRHVLSFNHQTTLDAEKKIIIEQENIFLYSAIASLPANYKEVIILKGIMEMPSKEVSEIMKSNENNINVLYHRSLKKLKSALEKEGYEYGGA